MSCFFTKSCCCSTFWSVFSAFLLFFCQHLFLKKKEDLFVFSFLFHLLFFFVDSFFWLLSWFMFQKTIILLFQKIYHFFSLLFSHYFWSLFYLLSFSFNIFSSSFIWTFWSLVSETKMFFRKEIHKRNRKKRGDMSKQFFWFTKSKTQNWRCESAQNSFLKMKITRRNDKRNKKNTQRIKWRSGERKRRWKQKRSQKKRRENSEEINKKTKRGLKNGSEKSYYGQLKNSKTKN